MSVALGFRDVRAPANGLTMSHRVFCVGSIVLAGPFMLEQFLELLDREASVSNDSAHCVFVDWIVSRYRDDSRSVSHDDMFALVGNLEAGFLQGTNRSKVINTGKLGHDIRPGLRLPESSSLLRLF